MNPISGVTIYQNSGAQTVSLAGITAGTSASVNFIQIWAYTSDSTIIPAPTVNYTGPNQHRLAVHHTSMPGPLGKTATITVTVNNGVANFNQTFTVSGGCARSCVRTGDQFAAHARPDCQRDRCGKRRPANRQPDQHQT